MLALGLTPERTLEQLVLDGASSDGGRLSPIFGRLLSKRSSPGGAACAICRYAVRRQAQNVRACAPASSRVGWGLRLYGGGEIGRAICRERQTRHRHGRQG